MELTLTNYQSGEVEISVTDGPKIRLDLAQSTRLILAARMRNVEPFVEKLAQLVPNAEIAATITALFNAADGSELWNLKEKFARLFTVTPGFEVSEPEKVIEQVTIN